MKLAMLAAALGLLVSVQPAAAQPGLEQQLYDVGREACASGLGGNLDGVDGLSFAQTVDSSNWTRSEYCHCVAEEFEDLDADDLATMISGTKDGDDYLAFIVTMNMAICLPDASQDGDLAEWEEEELPDEDFAYDEGDKYMCELALDDDLMMPGFDLEDVLSGMKRSGQSRDDLCTCAARYFTAGGEELSEMIENANNQTVVYASTMAGAIETCRL